MKTSILSFALALVLSANVFANDNADEVKNASRVVVNSTSRAAVYNLMYSSAKAGLVRVSIKNQEGTVVLQEEIFNENKGFIRPYNFSTMPAGTYSVVVKDAAGQTELSVSYSNIAISGVRKAEVKALESNKYQLRLVGNAAENVQVTIFDQSGFAIHSEDLTQKGSFTRTYDLGKLKIAKASFEIKADGKVISRVEL
jgi:hypothetical protein